MLSLRDKTSPSDRQEPSSVDSEDSERLPCVQALSSAIRSPKSCATSQSSLESPQLLEDPEGPQRRQLDQRLRRCAWAESSQDTLLSPHRCCSGLREAEQRTIIQRLRDTGKDGLVTQWTHSGDTPQPKSMLFVEFCELCAGIEREAGHLKKSQMVKGALEALRLCTVEQALRALL